MRNLSGMERSGTEVSTAPPTNPAGLRIPHARRVTTRLPGSPSGGSTFTPTGPDDTAYDTPVPAQLGHPDRAGLRTPIDGLEQPRSTRRWLRLALMTVACCTLGATLGAGLALADHRAVQRQATLVPLLADAAIAVQQVDEAGQPFNPTHLVDLLARLRTTDAAVSRVASGRAWQLATATTRRNSLAETSDRVKGLALLANAAGPLGESLSALAQPTGSDPDQLDALARDLNRFASVSLRAQQLGTYPAPSGTAGTPFEQLATAAAVLPTMAGSETRRYWVVCPTATSSCTRFAVQGGKVTGQPSAVERSIRQSGAADITVIGRAARELIVDGRLSVTAALDTLVATDSTAGGADDSAPVVTSAVPVEQHALKVIARHGTNG